MLAKENDFFQCPLCANGDTADYCRDKYRQYYICKCCGLVFVDPSQWLNASDEKAVYDQHQNSAADQAYRQFLSRLYQPLLSRLKSGDIGLDFGCGPGPTLSVMFEEAGFSVELYDIFYHDFPQVLERKYQFITATEVVEHLHHPGEIILKLWRQLNPGGVLGFMTKLLIDKEAFLSWHYKNDPTHICFFSKKTFIWFSNHLDAKLDIIGNDVILMTKSW